MFCKKCGQIIKENQKICYSCGTAVEDASPKTFNPADAFKAAVFFENADDLNGNSYSNTSNTYINEETKKETIEFERTVREKDNHLDEILNLRKKCRRMSIVLISVIVFLIGFGVVSAIKAKSDDIHIKDVSVEEKQNISENQKQEALVYNNLTYEIITEYEYFYNGATEYLPDGSILITGYIKEPQGEIEIPQMIDGKAVTGIDFSCFRDCTKITSVSLPEGILFIGNAFDGCTGLETINIPKSVRVMDGGFSNCTSLKSIVVPSDNTIMAGNFAFEGCTSLEYANVPNPGGYMFAECTALKEAVLRGSQGDISRITHFAGCTSLEKVTLPTSVEWIMTDGFSWCDNLKEIYYSGSEKQWKAIKTGSGYDELEQTPIKQFENVKIYYNATITPATQAQNQLKTDLGTNDNDDEIINLSAALNGKWVYDFEFDGEIYENIIELYEDGKTNVYLATQYGHVWYYASGTWKLQNVSDNNYFVELSITGGDVSELGESNPEDTYVVTICMRLDNNSAYVDKYSGDCSFIYYDQVFCRK